MVTLLNDGCSTKHTNPDPLSSIKFKQYYVQGEQLYMLHCSNCHQKSGAGLGLLYPPINKSDFMHNHVHEVLCLIRNGKDGELFVNGKQFNKKMPAQPALTPLEIAELGTYIYNTWEHKSGLIDIKVVEESLLHCTQGETKL